MRIEDIEPDKCYKIEDDRGFKFIIPYKKAIPKEKGAYCIPALIFNIYDSFDHVDVYKLNKSDHMFWIYEKDKDKISKATEKIFKFVIYKLFSSNNVEIRI